METSGQEQTSGQGFGLTSLQMQDPNVFVGAGWDLVGEQENGVSDIWSVSEEGGYSTGLVTFKPFVTCTGLTGFLNSGTEMVHCF